ncbi:MAG: NAD(P)/FAD-dependent oxidoreductase [Halolamina sp.]
MSEHSYEVAVVGGGPAGLTAALYTTRLGHETVLIDRGGGRAAMMQDTHNVIGVTEETSGNEFLQTGLEQVQSYGGAFHRGFVTGAEETDEGRFRLDAGDDEFVVDRVVLATGFSDERPEPPLPRTARGLHYCLHCDAYMFADEPVFVMGHSDSAAYVAMILLNFTEDVDLLLRDDEPTWSDETGEMLASHPVDVIEEDVTGVDNDDSGWLQGLEFEDDTYREYRGGFPMYGSDYNTELHEELGCELNDDGTVAVGDHGETSVNGVYAVGDVVPGHNQVPVAMGQGAKAGIQIHMDLRSFPKGVDELDVEGPVTEADVPAISPELLTTAITHEGHAGGPRESEVDQLGSEATADD